MSVFLTLPAIAAVAWTARRRAVSRPTADTAGAGLVLPVLYYGYSAIAGSLVRDQMRMRLEPHLIATAFFWEGLARMASRVETLPLARAHGVAAIVGTKPTRALAARGAARRLPRLCDRVHVSHADARLLPLPYIAVVAIGVAVLFARVESRSRPWSSYGTLRSDRGRGSMAAWPRLHEANAAEFDADVRGDWRAHGS